MAKLFISESKKTTVLENTRRNVAFGGPAAPWRAAKRQKLADTSAPNDTCARHWS